MIRKGLITCLLLFTCTVWAAPKVEVSGVLISSKGATAIINGKCYAVNDTVAGGRITSIEKGGITLQIGDKTWDFPVSGKEQSELPKSKKVSGILKRAQDRYENWKKRVRKKMQRKEATL